MTASFWGQHRRLPLEQLTLWPELAADWIEALLADDPTL
jgi:hypothetical protein